MDAGTPIIARLVTGIASALRRQAGRQAGGRQAAGRRQAGGRQAAGRQPGVVAGMQEQGQDVPRSIRRRFGCMSCLLGYAGELAQT